MGQCTGHHSSRHACTHGRLAPTSAQGSAEWVPPGDAHAGTKALNPHHRQKQKRIQLQQLLQQTSLVVPVQ